MPTRGGGGGGGGGKKVDVSFVQQEVPAFLQRAQERLGVGQAADAARERARLGRIAAAGESLHADEAPTVVDSLEAHKDAGALGTDSARLGSARLGWTRCERARRTRHDTHARGGDALALPPSALGRGFRVLALAHVCLCPRVSLAGGHGGGPSQP